MDRWTSTTDRLQLVDAALIASAGVTITLLALHEQFVAVLAALAAYAGTWLILRLHR